MAFEEYLAVRSSDLYDGRGHAKAVLTLIAHMIIGENEKEPDPDEGWCTATQDYLAMSLGVSVSTISWNIGIFERDGWVQIKTFRNKQGQTRNHYRLLRLGEIRERKTPKDEDGNYIRAKHPKKNVGVRGEKGKFTEPHAAARELDDSGLIEINLDNTEPHAAAPPNGTVPSRRTASCGGPNGTVRSKKVSEVPEEVSPASGCWQTNSEKDSGETPQTPKTDNHHSKAVKPQPAPKSPPTRSASPDTSTVPSGSSSRRCACGAKTYVKWSEFCEECQTKEMMKSILTPAAAAQLMAEGSKVKIIDVDEL